MCCLVDLYVEAFGFGRAILGAMRGSPVIHRRAFHPELKSRPFEPHPLFASFVQAAVVQSRLV
jgi:hypothetical protein